ncbi:transposase [Candidatus Vondammii sp. HM_W22]|uniref:transposase n=1 Tax=Candidatus Vondammii sp. HM_W22 TaxID=2687299 RepID=UPI002E7ACD8E|nr:transposase [Candidatus Vondammii sp. HM_W22]
MFKVLVLQHLFNFPDDQTGFQIRDRYSFCRFLGLSPGRVRYPMPKRFGCIVGT